MRAQVLGLALAVAPGGALYVPLGHAAPRRPGPRSLPTRALALLRPLLEDAGVRKLSANAKRDLVLLARKGVRGAGWTFDALLAAYLLNPGRRAYSLDELSVEFVGERRTTGAETAGPSASVEATAQAAGQDADVVLRMADLVTARLAEEQLDAVYAGMEMPLVAGAGRPGAGGGQDRHRPPRVDEPRHGGAARGPDPRDPRPGQGRVQHQLPGPAPRDPLRSPRTPEREEDGQDPGRLDRGRRARGARPRPRAAAEDPRLPVGAEAQVHLRRRPARARQPRDRPHPRVLQPDGGGHRPHLVLRSEPPEHPHPHRRGPAHPRGLRGRARATSCSPPTTARSSSGSSRTSRRTRPSSTPSAGGRTSTTAPRARSSGPSPPVPPDEQRRISKMVNYALLYGKTAFTLAKDIGVSRQGGGDLHRRLLRPLSRGAVVHRRDDRAGRARPARCARSSAVSGGCPTCAPRTPRSAWRRSVRP